jgi:hypothetical protein
MDKYSLKRGGSNMKDFGRPSEEAMIMALSFVKDVVIPRLIAEQKIDQLMEEIKKSTEKAS